MSSGEQAPTYSPENFNTDPYSRRVEKPWGYEIHLVPETAPYMMKIIGINAGAKLSMQIHDAKQESWTLMEGEAAVIWRNNQGKLIETALKPGIGYSTEIGQEHRLKGITDCKVLEASTPEAGTTWRTEDDYARPHETPEQRAIERGE